MGQVKNTHVMSDHHFNNKYKKTIRTNKTKLNEKKKKKKKAPFTHPSRRGKE